jgi:hypothetical protein
VNGPDTIYGGKNGDEMQADQGDSGKTPGDRLIDWPKKNNYFLVCNSGFGLGRVLYEEEDHVDELLVQLAQASGAKSPEYKGSSGFIELSLLDDDEKDPPVVWGAVRGKGTCETLP